MNTRFDLAAGSSEFYVDPVATITSLRVELMMYAGTVVGMLRLGLLFSNSLLEADGSL